MKIEKIRIKTIFELKPTLLKKVLICLCLKPIFAFGVFIYAWVRLRIKVVAFLAGLFFIISPIAWMWPFEWGFIAEAISAMFFPYTFLFFDLFLLRALERDWSFKTRLFLVLTIVLLGLSVMAHPFVFTGTLALTIVYGTLLALSRKDRIKSLFVAFASTIGNKNVRGGGKNRENEDKNNFGT